MIAALYVQRGGVYCGLPDVEPWDEERDARKYVGPWPVVAHPPCQRWGRYWYGGPMLHAQGKRKTMGRAGVRLERPRHFRPSPFPPWASVGPAQSTAGVFLADGGR
jgi:hypothetical protein